MNLYEADFYCWTQETADRLRRNDFMRIDVAALVEEVEDLGKRQKSAVQNRLAVLIAHLLKWDCQPSKRSRSWEATIELQRSRIERLLKQSPSLRPFLAETLGEVYRDAILLAIKDTGLNKNTFAPTSPYCIDEILAGKNIRIDG
ncbi:MAG: DUF29 domain-containing protein [Bryobacteraceae bacterium]